MSGLEADDLIPFAEGVHIVRLWAEERNPKASRDYAPEEIERQRIAANG